MVSSRPGRHIARRVPIIAAVVAVALAPGLPVAAAPAKSGAVPVPLPIRGVLNDVAMLSARSGWAVGRSGFCNPKTLIAQWNGTSWKRVSLPANGRRIWLDSIAATSASNAWTVGPGPGNSDTGQSQMLRWNGSAWTRVKLPRVTGGAQLFEVAATSAANAWAVGDASDGKGLILHWNGSAWTRVPSPGGDSNLSGVAATSARNAWAVGFTTAGSNHGLILHWNGITWTRVPVAGLPKQTLLLRVAAVSARDAWAVGTTDADKAVILRWNGTTWRQVKAPIKSAVLLGITALSGRDAWIAGTTSDNLGVGCAAGSASALAPVLAERSHPADGNLSPVILHWNGHRWQLVKNPSLPAGSALVGIAATSARSAWAVGGAGDNLGAKAKALVLHWNGKRWQ